MLKAIKKNLKDSENHTSGTASELLPQREGKIRKGWRVWQRPLVLMSPPHCPPRVPAIAVADSAGEL